MITIKRFPGSSIYYWAIYDFHDARVSGVPVAGTACDEVLSGGEGGTLRSPRNSLVFRHAPASRPLVCRYSIRAEDSLYSRIALTLDKLNFKAEMRQINIRMHADSNHSLQTPDKNLVSSQPSGGREEVPEEVLEPQWPGPAGGSGPHVQHQHHHRLCVRLHQDSGEAPTF